MLQIAKIQDNELLCILCLLVLKQSATLYWLIDPFTYLCSFQTFHFSYIQ